MLSKFNNKKHRRLTALLLCVALMLGSVTSVSADISAADSETEAQSGVQTYAEEPTAEAVSYGAPETQAEVQEETSCCRGDRSTCSRYSADRGPYRSGNRSTIQRRQLRHRWLKHRRLRQQRQKLRLRQKQKSLLSSWNMKMIR